MRETLARLSASSAISLSQMLNKVATGGASSEIGRWRWAVCVSRL